MVLLTDSRVSPYGSPPARLRSLAAPILAHAAIHDPRAYLWTDTDLGRLAAGVQLTGQDVVIDVGCGWGALGMLLAMRHPGTRVVGVDLDAGLLAVGQEVAAAAGLALRVQFVEGDLEDLDAADLGPSVVVGQAVLAHHPRAGEWLRSLALDCAAGARLGFVERDAVAAARAVRDSVTDHDAGYDDEREAVARAVARGAWEHLGVDRRAGGLVAGWLEAAGLAQVGSAEIRGDLELTPPYRPEDARASWYRRWLERRTADGIDPVDEGLAVSGGLGRDRYRSWVARRAAADRRRRRDLDAGRWSRCEQGGWIQSWGKVR